MPRVREVNPKNQRRAVIEYCKYYKGWDDGKLEKELGISHTTRISRMKDIDTFSLQEIQVIIKGVPLSPEQISILLGGVKWEVSTLQIKGGI